MSKKYPVVYICNYSGNYNFVIGEELSRRGYILLANSSSDSEKLRLRQLELCDLVYVDEVESVSIRMRIEMAYAKILGKRIISNGIGDFDGVTSKLDYLKNLGRLVLFLLLILFYMSNPILVFLLHLTIF